MCHLTEDDAPHSAPVDMTLHLSIEAEASLRKAGRPLEVLGVTNAESARLAPIAFRIARRVRTDRLAAA